MSVTYDQAVNDPPARYLPFAGGHYEVKAALLRLDGLLSSDHQAADTLL